MRNLSVKMILITAAVLFLFSCGTLGTESGDDPVLDLDPAVRSGVLENGLSWFVRPNSEPEKRASIRLVVNAGSVLEEEDQRGLAHFCEHMAFNGTENFKKSELVDYLESIGMAFGPEINAYTGFDETVYMLEIPTDDEDIVKNAFQVLEDWAHLVSYEDEEVEKERGVIQEEWRLGRGASGRIMDKLVPALFRGSRYADRLPIGLMDVVMNAPPQRLRDFYSKWYRPENMAVIVVGDIDPGRAEELVREHFSYVSPEPAAVRPVYDVPASEGTEVLLISDPELSYATVEISAKTGPVSQRTEADFRRMLVEQLAWSMLNDRFDEAARRPEPPFIGAGGGIGRIVRGSGSASCYASADSDSAEDALEALLYELERAARYGFSGTEWTRKTADFLDSIEEYYLERENLPSAGFARELSEYFLSGVFMPGPEGEYELYNRLIPEIELAEVNAFAAEMIPREGRIVTVIYPEAASVPGEEVFLDLAENAGKMPVERWTDDALERELLDEVPEAGSITGKQLFDDIDAELWTLSNGADVVVKQTDFRDDEILFSAFSRGGLSLVGDDSFISGRYAPLLLSQSGLGDFSATQLQKKLAGLSVSISPYIGQSYEGISGSFSPDELDVFMQLLYMHFTAPSFDGDAYSNLVSRLSSIIENRKADPMNAYYDRVTEILTGDDFRSRPLSEESLAAFLPEVSERVWSERFAGADDFVFVFTGNIDREKLAEACELYIASLPAGPSPEEPVDLGVRPPDGPVDELVVRGIDPQSRVSIYFNGELEDWSPDFELQAGTAASVLETLLRERIREELSGTYHISARAMVEREPHPSWRLGIEFGCEPERTDELTDKVFEVIAGIAGGNLDEEYIVRQEQHYRRTFEESVQENPFWLMHLEESFAYGDDPEDILGPDDFNEKISRESIVETLNLLTDPKNFIRVVLKPET